MTVETTCGGTFDSKAMAKGHASECGCSIVDADAADADADDADQTAAQPATDDAYDLAHVAWVGGFSFVVWSGEGHGSDDNQRAHRVRLDGDLGPTCNCEHGQHNQGDDAACWHVRDAIMAAHATPDVDLRALKDWSNLLHDAHELRTQMGATGQTPPSDGADTAESASADDAGQSGSALRDALKEAFSDSKFNVDHVSTVPEDQQIAFELGYYEGDFSDVQAITSDVDMVGYDGDQNYLDYDDVERYIQEVLE